MFIKYYKERTATIAAFIPIAEARGFRLRYGNMVDELNHKLHDGNVESAMIIIINKDGGFEYTMSSNIPYLTAIGLLDSFNMV